MGSPIQGKICLFQTLLCSWKVAVFKTIPTFSRTTPKAERDLFTQAVWFSVVSYFPIWWILIHLMYSFRFLVITIRLHWSWENKKVFQSKANRPLSNRSTRLGVLQVNKFEQIQGPGMGDGPQVNKFKQAPITWALPPNRLTYRHDWKHYLFEH